ncbi:uncharacterized protein LOC126706863 isoform X6 [Quercus robur]|uniref:uncharacterized protein LOC126706863 isoform X6 n=1 Tax=Quercus robur TaxID=38942 RepID=UPI002163E1AB|nr:uncharacterized protein LOC126706863 isoform X6 [Quercus robur]
MVKKGKDTHNKITEYEMERAQRIKQNQEKIDALRLKYLSTFLPQCANVGRKRVSVQVDDDDYVPAISDDELSSSLNNEMAPGRSTRSRREKFTPTVQHKGLLSRLLPGGGSEMAPGRSTRSRREKFTPTVQHKDPLSSLLPGGDSEMARYKREESTPAVQHTGPSLSTHLGGDSLAQISTNVEAQLVGTPSTTDASTSRRSRGMTRGLGVRGLLEKHGKLPVRIAPEFCAPVGEHTGKLVSQIGVHVRTNLSTMNAYSWKNVGSGEKEAIIQNVAKVSERNAKNRNKEETVDKHIHRCGSKSLAVRVDEARRKNGGHIPKVAQLYYDTHFNSKTKQWVHPDCEHTYQEMLRVQDEHCSTPEAQPLTEDEISMMVLKPRSGYVKGLGMRPSSSLKTPASSSSTQYTQQLEGRVEELQDANYKLEDRVEELQDANFRLEEKMDCIIQYLRSKGDSDICGSGGSSSTN